MAKYRLLSDKELKLMEKDFIEYLVVNSITADDWIKLKKNDSEKAEKIIELFSDVVLEKVLRKSQYLKKINKDSILCFHYQSNQVVLVGLQENTPGAITKLGTSQSYNIDDYELMYSEKAYKEQRELEMYHMIEKGATISDGKLYKQLILLTAEK
jgi:hypothetical protein